MTFGLTKFCQENEEVLHKREGLEVMHILFKSCFFLCFLLKPLAIFPTPKLFKA